MSPSLASASGQRGGGGGEFGGRRAFVLFRLANLRRRWSQSSRETMRPTIASARAKSRCASSRREAADRWLASTASRRALAVATAFGPVVSVICNCVAARFSCRRVDFELGAQLGETQRSLALVDHHQRFAAMDLFAVGDRTSGNPAVDPAADGDHVGAYARVVLGDVRPPCVSPNGDAAEGDRDQAEQRQNAAAAPPSAWG